MSVASISLLRTLAMARVGWVTRETSCRMSCFFFHSQTRSSPISRTKFAELLVDMYTSTLHAVNEQGSDLYVYFHFVPP